MYRTLFPDALIAAAVWKHCLQNTLLGLQKPFGTITHLLSHFALDMGLRQWLAFDNLYGLPYLTDTFGGSGYA